VLGEAVAAGLELELVVVREGDRFTGTAQARVTVTPGVFRELTQTVTPQGVLAVARVSEALPGHAIAAARQHGWPLVVLDGVQDPGNVGAICRSAAAAGAPALVVLQGTADPYGAKAVRASAGNVFRLTVAQAAWSDLSGLDGYGAAAQGGTPVRDSRIERAGMVVFGSEAHGLSRQDLAKVTIPVQEGVESLNVAAAAAVLLFEIRRRLAA